MRPMGWVAVAVAAVAVVAASPLSPRWTGSSCSGGGCGIIIIWLALARCDPRQFYGVLGLGDGGDKMGLASTPIGTTVNISYMTAW